MLGIFYWILILLSIVLNGYVGFGPNGNRLYFGSSLLVTLLFIIIGLKLFPVAL